MKIATVLFFTIIVNIGFAQLNLIPNSSFEFFTDCNRTPESAPPWYDPTGASSDYLNACDTIFGYGVPKNMYGFRYARTGNAYAFFGISLYWYNLREYIAVPLLEPLKNNKKYYYGMYVTLADSSEYGIDNIGALFTVGPIDTNGQGGYIINYSPQISSKNIIIDTVNWVLIDGVFIANGGENYLTIGCFVPDDSVKFISISQVQRFFAGYYIDDIFLFELKEPDTSTIIVISNAFTPNNDGINDIFRVQGENIEAMSGTIINRWGQELYKWADVNGGWDGRYKGQDVAEGTYFYIITVTFANGETENFTGSLLLTR